MRLTRHEALLPRLPNVDKRLSPTVPPPMLLPRTDPVLTLRILPLLLTLPAPLFRPRLIDPLVVRFRETPEPDRFDADTTFPQRAEPPPLPLGGERPKLVLRPFPLSPRRNGDPAILGVFNFIEPSPTDTAPLLSRCLCSEPARPLLSPPLRLRENAAGSRLQSN